MEAHEWEIDYYATEEGKCPFREWILNLRDARARQKIKVRIDRVSLGNLGYYERLVVLLCGGDKSSQKRDIEKAQEYWADYRRRYD